MATKYEVSRGLKKALMERTSGTGTMEEMMAEETAVIASTSNAILRIISGTQQTNCLISTIIMALTGSFMTLSLVPLGAVLRLGR